MTNTKIFPDVMPSATPSEEEIAAWKALPRDEQLRRLRLEVTHPDACVAGPHSMADIWDKIKARRLAEQKSGD